MELTVGETFEYDGHLLKASPVESEHIACEGCYFYENNICCYHLEQSCTDDSRSDQQNVVFKEIKNK